MYLYLSVDRISVRFSEPCMGARPALRHQAAVAVVPAPPGRSHRRVRAPKVWLAHKYMYLPLDMYSVLVAGADHMQRQKITSTVRGQRQHLTVCANRRSQETLAEQLGYELGRGLDHFSLQSAVKSGC